MTFPQKLFPPDCITLYRQALKNMPMQKKARGSIYKKKISVIQQSSTNSL